MLSAEEVKHIALLARVGVTDEEVESYRKSLSGVLDFVKELESIDGENVAILRNVVGREDVYRNDLTQQTDGYHLGLLMDNAPEKKDGYVKVKSVF